MVSFNSKELLARYIVSSRWIRNSDNTVKPEAFIPHPYPNLSVTRHAGISIEQMWEIGKRIVSKNNRTLHGRADVSVGSFRKQKLGFELIPEDGNANHVNVTDWPARKHEQKDLAFQICKEANFIRSN